MNKTARQEWEKGWTVVLGAAVGFASGMSVLSFASSVFVEPLQEAFGWSRGQIGFYHYAGLAVAFMAPVIGRLTDRFGVRLIAASCLTAVGLVWIALASMTGSLFVFYALFGLFYVVGLGTTGMTFTRAVTSWFDKSRGLALACTNLGMTIVGMALPAVLYFAISQSNWRAGFLVLAALALLVGLPATLLLVRERPASPADTHDAQIKPSAFLTVLANRKVLLVCFAGALTYAPFAGVVSQLHPLLTDAEIAPNVAANVLGMLAGSALIGTMLAGWLVDRIWAPAVGFVFTAAPIIGCVILLSPTLHPAFAAVAVILLGMAQGAEVQLIAYLIGKYFPMRDYSTIFGVSLFIVVTLASTAAILFGFAHDYFGHYRYALMAAATCFGFAAGLYLLLGPYPNQRDAEG